MSRGDAKRLDDIRDMCTLVASIVARSREAVEADAVAWLALERAIEIAGEAATQLSDEARSQFPSVAWRELIGVRIVLAHAYHRVDGDLLWGIAADDLPTVAEALGPPGDDPDSAG